SLAIAPSYSWLLVVMALAGVANGVYHPADYALLSRGIEPERMGRAFSIHTFSGYFGGAIAPLVLMAVATWAAVEAAFLVAGLVGAAAMLILCLPTRETAYTAADEQATTKRSGKGSALSVLTPAVLVLTLLFVLLNLSASAIEKFSVAALVQGFDVPLSWANAGLTAFLFASAFGVLAGGSLADRTRHHGLVAAAAFGLAAVL